MKRIKIISVKNAAGEYVIFWAPNIFSASNAELLAKAEAVAKEHGTAVKITYCK